MIAVHNVSKTYGKAAKAYVAVSDVSFGVRRGEAYGLLGPNGAGKTTMLRMVSTLLRPSSGDIRVGDHGLDNPLGIRSQIGIVNGGMKVYERNTGLEILEFFSKMYALEHPKQHIDWVVDRLGIPQEVLRKQVRHMSAGMQQKIIIGRAIVHQPAVLLLDEASNGLDIFARRNLMDFVQEYKQRAAVVYSTHVMHEAQEVCDRVGFMHQGRLLLEGVTADVMGGKSLEAAFVAAVEASA